MNGGLLAQLGEFDAASLYDAAGQTGMVDPAIKRMWPGAQLCGIAFTLSCPPKDNLMLHHAVIKADPGSVLVCNSDAYERAGAWGEILTVAAQMRGIQGLVIDGAVRDLEAIERRKFPVFSRGAAIGACKKEQMGTMQQPIILGGVPVRSGDYLVGSADGLVVIAKESINRVLTAAIERRQNEQALIRELESGKTTIEIMNLPPLNPSVRPTL